MAIVIHTDILPGEDRGYSLGNSSNKWLLNGNVKELIELTVQLTSADGESLTIQDSRITSNHVVLESAIVEPVGVIIGS